MFENKLFRDWSGLVGPGRVGNSDSRANSAQFQVKFPTGAEPGNTKMVTYISCSAGRTHFARTKMSLLNIWLGWIEFHSHEILSVEGGVGWL